MSPSRCSTSQQSLPCGNNILFTLSLRKTQLLCHKIISNIGLAERADSLTQVTSSSCILQQSGPSYWPKASIDVSSASHLLQCSSVTFSCRATLYRRYIVLHGVQPKLLMIKEVQTQVFAATSCNFPDMLIAPTTPDCILSLRDGSSIAATSARLHGLLAQHQSSHQPSGLPVYALDQPPAAVKLLHSILEDEVDPMVGHMPSLSSIM